MCRFINVDNLINHLQTDHEKDINITARTFSNFELFLQFKDEFEKSTSSFFVLNSSPKQRAGGYLCYYYYCNRSGCYTPKGKGKRELKIQRSSKIGSHCTAYIRARKYLESNEVCVDICDYHIHERELCHLRLPDSLRHTIAAKLNDGVTISTIMDSIRDNVDKTDRAILACCQDVHNVRHQYNMDGIKLHANDYESVSLFIQSMAIEQGDDNPIIMFKEQDKEQPSNLNDLSKDDFLVAIQTSFQADMLTKFGGNAVCMDSTHGTNSYDFFLITLLVLDELGEGIPVCWIISNREDATVIRQVLLKVKERCGNIQAKIFMSDDANNFFNAWQGTFSIAGTKKLLCAWHLDKSFRSGLQKHVKSKTKQLEVYHQLRVLLNEGEESLFRLRLQQFISSLSDDADLIDYKEYFLKEYVQRLEQWAPCFRVATAVNTNMAVEAFHRSLKVCYMEKKNNRRIDRLIHILLKIGRDKVFERIIKTQKGKTTYRLSEINKRHKVAV
jgi:hypothetical protein